MKRAEFEWDQKKASSNLEKHGISFNEALLAFDDPFALIAPDDRHSSRDERREWLIGENDEDILVVVFTRRMEIVRIISARKANKKERYVYETFKRIPIP